MTKRSTTFIAFCIISAVLCSSLGVWQVKRLFWKNELINDMEYSQRMDPVKFPLSSNTEKISEFRKVEVSGKFLHKQEIFLRAKFNKEELGFHIVTPMLLKDNTIILVNRGWAPKEIPGKNIEKLIYRPNEPVTIKAIIRNGVNSPWFVPKNVPEENRWFWMDDQDMLPFFRRKNPDNVVRPIFLQSIETSKYPKSLPTEFIVRNDHLQYAITWFSLTFIIFIMTIYYLKTDPKKK